jgi:hypothetical protein
MATRADQRRALSLLAGSPHGCTVANVLAHGFTNAMLDRLVRDGLATIEPGTACAGTRRVTSAASGLPESRTILTGMRCTIFVKLPVAFAAFASGCPSPQRIAFARIHSLDRLMVIPERQFDCLPPSRHEINMRFRIKQSGYKSSQQK